MTRAYPNTSTSSGPHQALSRTLYRDAYLTSSLLQKAVRRGDTPTALHAADVLHQLRGNSIWRRLAVIAFEDVGIGSPDVVVEIVRLATGGAAREHLGSDALRHAVTLLADAPKERSADYLICSAVSRPDLETARERVGCATVSQRLRMVADLDLPLPVRATAAWYLSGLNATPGGPLDRGDRPNLLRLFEALGVPAEVVKATRVAATITREPMTLMLPLLWLELTDAPAIEVTRPEHGRVAKWQGLPLYALDKHTRLGKRAIRALLSELPGLRQQLLDFVPPYRMAAVAEMAAFYLDAVPVSPQLQWKRSAELMAYGLETDMLKVGTPRDGIGRIMEIISDHREDLDAVRGRLLQAAYGDIEE